MTHEQKAPEERGDLDAWEWEYPPPPTVYDLIRDNPVTSAARILVHLCSRGILHCYHNWTASGTKNFLSSRPCILTPNHASHLDVFALFAALPLFEVGRTCSVAAKDYFFRHPVPSLLARVMANAIPIERKGVDRRGLALCGKKLTEGKSLIIFPEGTRSRTGELGEFKAGAVMLSRRFRAPVVPTYIKGALESMPKGRFFPRRRDIAVVFAEPLRFWEGELARMQHGPAAELVREGVGLLKRTFERIPSNEPDA